MNDIINWIKSEKLWFCVGYRIVHSEFDAEIWCHVNRGDRLVSIGWWGKGQTMEEALTMAYEKCKEKLYTVQSRIKAADLPKPY